MRAEALQALLRVRGLAVKDAQRALADAIRIERDMLAVAAEADAAITREADAAASLSAGDGAVEAYARWLPTGRRRAAEARLRLERATQDVALARTALGLAKAAEKAVAGEVDRLENETRARRAAREQTELDDVGARSATTPTSPDARRLSTGEH